MVEQLLGAPEQQDSAAQASGLQGGTRVPGIDSPAPFWDVPSHPSWQRRVSGFLPAWY